MRIGAIILAVLLILASATQAAPPEVIGSLKAKLDRWDVEEAWVEIKDLLLKEPKDGELLELASQIAFYQGEYQEALLLIKAAIDAGGDEKKKNSFALFVEQTLGVISHFKKYESSHFMITLDEKENGFLIDYIIEALESTYKLMAEQYDFKPREKVRVELFPDARTFYYASSLSARDIEIGAVGQAEFNKLMILSPGALVHGYRWLDAVSHEYMHYLILKMTANKAPIWFHEGLAKYEETRWRKGPSYLSPLYQTLLSRGLIEQRLIRFEKMEPSLIKLETPDDVQLAYAQAASAIEFIIAKAGHRGLKEVMKGMASKSIRGAGESIKDVMGMTFDEFERSWKDFLTAKGYQEVKGVHVRRYKIKEGRADEERMDMEEIKSLVARNRAHLADLLKERGRTGAAILEYRRALAETPDSVPILNRISSVLIGLEKDQEALPFLNRAKEISPDHPVTYIHLGKTHLKVKDVQGAKEAFLESIEINPFIPEAHDGLAKVYEILGEKALASREKEIVKKLGQR